jgi:hypothetical protein
MTFVPPDWMDTLEGIFLELQGFMELEEFLESKLGPPPPGEDPPPEDAQQIQRSSVLFAALLAQIASCNLRD